MAGWWTDALVKAMSGLRATLPCQLDRVSGIGVTGHMHCMVRRCTDGSKPFGGDLWNDPRGVPESDQLIALLEDPLPARWTACHILGSLRDLPSSWSCVDGVSVTSGSIVHDLTGEWVLGPGDATGMFGGLDPSGQISPGKLDAIDLASGRAGPASTHPALKSLAPRVVAAGEVAGRLSAEGVRILGGLSAGTPVAAPEGDQQAVLVCSAAQPGELALSLGTSLTGNLVCDVDTPLVAQDESANVLSTPDGKPMATVCCRNGTVGFGRYVRGLAALSKQTFDEVADYLTDLAQTVPVHCYGTKLVGFFQGENVAGLPQARASLHGAGVEVLEDPGVMARLLLEAPCMTLRYGLSQLAPHTGPVRRVVVAGGGVRSKGGLAMQMYADILGVPVLVRSGDEEGSAKGAAVLAAYMHHRTCGGQKPLPVFAEGQITQQEHLYHPNQSNRRVYDERYKFFCQQ
eukprot:gene3938-4304_t